ncbi:unnamed protein product, partial [Rotaria sp. Silwood2]
MVKSHVETSLNRKVPLSNIQRYGKKECGIKCRKTHELALRDTIYAIMPPCRTFVAPEHKPLIIVDKSAAYAERFDFIGAINGPKVMPYMTLTPIDRKNKDVKGVRKEV